MDKNRIQQLILTGVIITLRENTAKVRIKSTKKHPKYLKRYSTHKLYHASVPTKIKLAVGDEVNITRTKPQSRLKRWIIVKS